MKVQQPDTPAVLIGYGLLRAYGGSLERVLRVKGADGMLDRA